MPRDASPAPTAELPKHGESPRWILLLAALGIGAAVAVQSQLLADSVVDSTPLAVAMQMFAVGLGVLSIAVVVLAPVRQGLRALSRALRAGSLGWPALLGGVAGAYFVAAQGSVVGAIGVTIFTICVVAGQVVSGGILDVLGFAGPRRRLTGLRIVGTLLVLMAVTVAGSFPAGSRASVLHLAMAFVAGLGGAWASATAGRVREASSSSIVAGIVNFSAALPVLAVLWGIEAAFSTRGPVFGFDARVAISAVIGVGVVCSASRLVRNLGVLLLGLCMVAGQLSAALAIETLSGSTDVSLEKFLAAFLICVAVAVASTTTSHRTPQRD